MFILFILALIALTLNLPLGYLRSKTKRFSLSWFLYIHISIPFIILMRIWFGFNYKAIPLLAIGAVAGQFVGGHLNRRHKQRF